MEVALLTTQESYELTGQLYAPDSYFNPIMDGNVPSNWIISTIETNSCVNPDFQWVKSLPLIEWVAPQPLSGSI
jgi:hypothetical protein